MRALLSVILFAFGAFAFPVSFSQEKTYTFIKKDKGVSLYYRWIITPDKHKVRELKAELEIHSSPEKIISVIRNDKQATHWMKGTSEVNRLGKYSEDQWQFYVQYEIPWPLSNQDCVIQYDIKKEADGKYYHIGMKGLPSYIAEKEGVTRIQHLQGVWKITPINKNSCKVEYAVHSGQAPKFPRWITDPIIQGNFINTMEAFKLTVEKN